MKSLFRLPRTSKEKKEAALTAASGAVFSGIHLPGLTALAFGGPIAWIAVTGTMAAFIYFTTTEIDNP